MFGGLNRTGWKQEADGMNWIKSHTEEVGWRAEVEDRTLKGKGETQVRKTAKQCDGLKAKKFSYPKQDNEWKKPKPPLSTYVTNIYTHHYSLTELTLWE